MRRVNSHWILAAFTLGALLWLSGCLTPPDRPEHLSAVARWQDQRLAPADSLRAMLTSKDAHVRLAAVRAAGLIGRNDVLPHVRQTLGDVSQTVAAEGAWALGLIGDAHALADLDRLATDTRPRLRQAAIAALGQFENDGAALLLATTHEDPETAALAWNSLRNQATRTDSTALREAIVAGLARPEADVRWRVLRCVELVPDSTLVPLISPFVRSPHAQVVVHAYRALARQPGSTALTAALGGIPHLDNFDRRDAARVRIAACRALGALGAATPHDHDGDIAAELITHAGHEDSHVAETALAAMARLVADRPLPDEAATQESLLPVWRIRLARSARTHLQSTHVAVRANAARALGAVRGTGAAAELLDAIEHETVAQARAAALTAYADVAPTPGPLLAEYCRADRSLNAMVRAAALTGLNQVRLTRPDAAQAPYDRDGIEGVLLTAAADPDFVVSTTAAGLLGTVPSDESVLALTSLWHRASGAGRFEIRRGVLSGLAAIFSTPPADASGDWHPPVELRDEVRRVVRASFDSIDIRIRREGRQAAVDTGLLPENLIPSAGSLLATLPAQPRDERQPPVEIPFKAPHVRCVTPHGDFRIELDGDLAPNTCALFLSLIEQGYFENGTFHRVVPDFVVQGGDPDGNGWGGPGFTIRSEWSRARYERAAVGIAHDGKDTGGSQFFVTLSPQPHLNGRYTIFGWVDKGMDIVDRIEVADTFRLELVE